MFSDWPKYRKNGIDYTFDKKRIPCQHRYRHRYRNRCDIAYVEWTYLGIKIENNCKYRKKMIVAIAFCNPGTITQISIAVNMGMNKLLILNHLWSFFFLLTGNEWTALHVHEHVNMKPITICDRLDNTKTNNKTKE